MHRCVILGCFWLSLLACEPQAAAPPSESSSTQHTGTNAWVPDTGPASVTLEGVAPISWAFSFGSEQTDWVNRVVARADGSLVAVGFINRADSGPDAWDGFVHEFEPDGTPLRTRRFGGTGLDALWSVREGADGTLAAAGFSDTDSAGDTDLWLVLLPGDGESVIEQRYGGPAAEIGFDLVAAGDGGFLLVGQTNSYGAGERDVFLVRTDAHGEELWRRSYGGPHVDRGFYGVQTSDGDFVIAGVTGPEDAYDMLVLKVSDTGEELWRQVIGGDGNDPNHGINLLPDGRIVVVGYGQSHDATMHDLVAATIAPDGQLLSHELLGGPGDDRAINSITAADGSTWIVGYTTSYGAGGWDAMLARLGPDGRFEPWLGAVGTAYDDHGATLLELADGNLLVGGYSRGASQGTEPDDLLLARFDPAGLVRRTHNIAHRRIR